MCEVFLEGLGSIFLWPTFGFMLMGTAIGFLVGLLPGLGGATALVMMLPYVFRMTPVTAFAFLLGMAAVVSTTGDITSILFGIPGESDCAASILDGYPMTRKGEGGRAVGASLMSSLIGALFGGIILVLAIPVLHPLVLACGSPGLFMLGVLGLLSMAGFGNTHALKGLIAGGLGLSLALVGLDPFTATPRLTFHQLYLWDGIPLIPVTLGLFALPEVLELAATGKPISAAGVHRMGTIREGILDVGRHWKLVLRCSGIGALIGMIPGVGSGIGQFMAYAHARSSSSQQHRFGHGAVEGVIGPGAANNSKEGGALIPTLAFGVPGGLHTAILLSAFTVTGLTPGLAMLQPQKHLVLTYSFVSTIVVSNLIVVPLSLLVLPQLVRLTQVRIGLLTPFLLTFIFLGSFCRNTFGDVAMVMVFGALGLLMTHFSWPRPPLLIGLVLGPMLEKNFFISMDAYGGLRWLLRPAVIVMLALALCSILAACARWWRQFRARSQRGLTGSWKIRLKALFSLSIAMLLTLALIKAFYWPSRARFFPMVVLPTVLGLTLLNLVQDIRLPSFLQKVSHDMPSWNANKASLRRLNITIVWTILFFLVLWWVGFPVGIPLVIFCYLKIASGETWKTSVLCSMGAWLLIIGVFGRLLHFPFPEGELGALLAIFTQGI